MMGIVKGESADFFFNPTQENGGSTDISQIKSYDKLNIHSSVIVQHPTEVTEALAVAKLLTQRKLGLISTSSDSILKAEKRLSLTFIMINTIHQDHTLMLNLQSDISHKKSLF